MLGSLGSNLILLAETGSILMPSFFSIFCHLVMDQLQKNSRPRNSHTICTFGGRQFGVVGTRGQGPMVMVQDNGE